MYHQFSWLRITSLTEVFLGCSDGGHANLQAQHHGLTSVGVVSVIGNVLVFSGFIGFRGNSIIGPLRAVLKWRGEVFNTIC
jgi:hypothetical protein